MEDWAKRLVALQKRHGWSTAELGRRAGVSKDRAYKYVKGKVEKPRGDILAKLATALGVSPIWLEKGVGPQRNVIEVHGFVGAGEVFVPTGESIGEVELDVGAEAPVAVQVRGQSMLPVYRPGDILIGERLEGDRIAEAVGRDCIVLLDSGEGYVKRLVRSASRLAYDLISYSADPIQDVVPLWVAPIRWVRRAG